jgi:hypothetical protein
MPLVASANVTLIKLASGGRWAGRMRRDELAKGKPAAIFEVAEPASARSSVSDRFQSNAKRPSNVDGPFAAALGKRDAVVENTA